MNKKSKIRESQTRLYSTWQSMKRRCYYKKEIRYKNYGGRGIKVCSEWKHNFKNFKNWALANGYNDTLTIDRIDVNKNYCPENCRWATYKEQARNKTNNRLITYNGETHCIQEWSEIIGIKRTTLKQRLNVYHWSIEKALTTPTIIKKKKAV